MNTPSSDKKKNPQTLYDQCIRRIANFLVDGAIHVAEYDHLYKLHVCCGSPNQEDIYSIINRLPENLQIDIYKVMIQRHETKHKQLLLKADDYITKKKERIKMTDQAFHEFREKYDP